MQKIATFQDLGFFGWRVACGIQFRMHIYKCVDTDVLCETICPEEPFATLPAKQTGRQFESIRKLLWIWVRSNSKFELWVGLCSGLWVGV